MTPRYPAESSNSGMPSVNSKPRSYRSSLRFTSVNLDCLPPPTRVSAGSGGAFCGSRYRQAPAQATTSGPWDPACRAVRRASRSGGVLLESPLHERGADGLEVAGELVRALVGMLPARRIGSPPARGGGGGGPPRAPPPPPRRGGGAG